MIYAVLIAFVTSTGGIVAGLVCIALCWNDMKEYLGLQDQLKRELKEEADARADARARAARELADWTQNSKTY